MALSITEPTAGAFQIIGAVVVGTLDGSGNFVPASGGSTDVVLYPVNSGSIAFATSATIGSLSVDEADITLTSVSIGPVPNVSDITVGGFASLTTVAINGGGLTGSGNSFGGTIEINTMGETAVYLTDVTTDDGVLTLPADIDLYFTGSTETTSIVFLGEAHTTVDFTGLMAVNPITMSAFAAVDTLTVYLGDNIANPEDVVDDLVAAGGANGTLSMNDASTQTGSADLVTAGWTLVDL